ncbi:hypothetical protein EMCRGX_G002480 [Ephydatia muelleri]
MTSAWSSTEDCKGSKEVVSDGKGRETDRGGKLPSAGTIDSEQWQTQFILMIPLQDSQQLKLAKWKFQLLGILQ